MSLLINNRSVKVKYRLISRYVYFDQAINIGVSTVDKTNKQNTNNVVHLLRSDVKLISESQYLAINTSSLADIDMLTYSSYKTM